MWIKKGLLNTLELGLTRAFDALLVFVLIKILPKQEWSKLIVAQNICLPLLVVFISPSGALYRHFVTWKEEGRSVLSTRLRSLRIYGISLALVAALLAWMLAMFFPKAQTDSHFQRDFFAYLWALSLYTGMHWSGADREYLRLELKMKTLNALTFSQKAAILFGSVGCAWFFPKRTDFLCLWTILCLVASAVATTRFAKKSILHVEESPAAVLPTHRATLGYCFKGFSIWFHLNGIILSWVQGLHLNVLSFLRYPESVLGIFGVAVKLANLTSIIPSALGNFFQVYLGRVKRTEQEMKSLFQYTIRLFGVSLLLMAVIFFMGPYLLQILGSRHDALNAWSPLEYETCMQWMLGLSLALFFMNGAWLIYFWLNQRGNVKRLFVQVFIPWLLIAVVVFSISAKLGGPDGVAYAGIPVALAYLVLLLVQVWREA